MTQRHIPFVQATAYQKHDLVLMRDGMRNGKYSGKFREDFCMSRLQAEQRSQRGVGTLKNAQPSRGDLELTVLALRRTSRWFPAGPAAGSPLSPRRVPARSRTGSRRVPNGSRPGPR